MKILFDVTGVLTSPEVNPWELINTRLGMTEDDDALLYKQFHEEKSLSYQEWIEQVVASWTERDREAIQLAGKELGVTQPAIDTIKQLKGAGHEIGLFSTLPDVILGSVAVDISEAENVTVYSPNQLIFEDGKLEGVDVKVNDEPSARLELAKALGMSLGEIVFVGRSENCVSIMQAAGLSFAPENSPASKVATATYQNLGELPALVKQHAASS